MRCARTVAAQRSFARVSRREMGGSVNWAGVVSVLAGWPLLTSSIAPAVDQSAGLLRV